MSHWYTVVIEGHERDLRAFVSGFLAERGLDAAATAVFGDDVGLEHGSLVERLRTLLRGGHHAVLAPGTVADQLVEALELGGAPLGLRVADHHPVASASFRFAAEVFSRDVSSAIRTILRALPAGVRFEQHAESEDEHTEHKGVELYAPVHHYAYRVRGKPVGPLGGILEVRRRLGEIEAVVLEPLQLA
jgi:hypothetical protein